MSHKVDPDQALQFHQRLTSVLGEESESPSTGRTWKYDGYEIVSRDLTVPHAGSTQVMLPIVYVHDRRFLNHGLTWEDFDHIEELLPHNMNPRLDRWAKIRSDRIARQQEALDALMAQFQHRDNHRVSLNELQPGSESFLTESFHRKVTLGPSGPYVQVRIDFLPDTSLVKMTMFDFWSNRYEETGVTLEEVRDRIRHCVSDLYKHLVTELHNLDPIPQR